MKINRAAHYFNSGSDKIYIVSIRRTYNSDYAVIAKWGRRGRTFQEQQKNIFSSFGGAEQWAENLFNTKLAKGYVDIDSSKYTGPVTWKSIENYCEKDINAIPNDPKFDTLNNVKITEENEEKAEKIVKEFGFECPPIGEQFVVKCINNKGMEDNFINGVTYMAEAVEEADMLKVYDKFGKERICFKDRFELENEVLSKESVGKDNSGFEEQIRAAISLIDNLDKWKI